MRRLCYLILFVTLVAAGVLTGCRLDTKNGIADDESFSSEEVVLGEKMQNPFSISAARSVDSSVQPNYYYFKVRTNDYEKVIALEEKYGTLETIPIDYEIEEGGVYYTDNECDDEYSPWYYLMKPVEDYYELSQEYETELIEEMYVSDGFLSEFEGDDCEDASEDDATIRAIKKVKPKGRVMLYDAVLGKYVPMSNVKVVASYWLVSKSSYTDKDGYFSINHKFKSIGGKVKIKVEFENPTTRVKNAYALTTAKYSIGKKSVSSLDELEIYLKNDTAQAKLGTIVNASDKYRSYARLHNVTNPKKLHFWANKNLTGGVTLMSYEVLVADLASMGAVLGGLAGIPGVYIGAVFGGIVGTYFPDIIIGTRKSANMTYTETITECVFHEMAHASHYQGIGSGRVSYWNKEYVEMIGGWVRLLKDDKDPRENTYNDGKSQLVCLIESWAYFYGYFLMNEEYGGYDNHLEVKNYKNRFPYFYNEAFYDLMDAVDEEGDLCRGYTVGQMFNALKSKDVQSIEDYIERLCSLYPGQSDKEAIRDTFVHAGAKL